MVYTRQIHQMNGIVPQPAIPAQKRRMRRPYKSMSDENLISKKSVLQVKLAVLQNRVNMWSEKVGKYEFELRLRTESPVDRVSSVGGANGDAVEAVEPITENCG